MKTDTRHQAPRIPRAFTLVELMVVIFILAVLAGILVPSVSVARTAAKQAATGALLNSIGSGLDMFKTESKLGRQYPPSKWDTTQDGSPYAYGMGNFFASGAQTLVWGLVGADMLGTPGFQIDPINGVNLSKDTGCLYEPNSKEYNRYLPFIDLSKTKIMTPSELGITLRPVPATPPGDPKVPVIIDSFNNPILYYRAKEGETKIEKIYPDLDNAAFLNPTLLPNGDPQDPIAVSQTTFSSYILDARATKLAGRNVPHNWDRFLLISAGADKRYGTLDDVVNWHKD